MSQQRPDRIKQMLHYLWQHRHLSTQQASSGLITRTTPIWRTAKKFCKPIIWHHLLRWQTGWRLALRMPQSATIMSMAVTVRPWFSLKVFLFSPRSVNAA